MPSEGDEQFAWFCCNQMFQFHLHAIVGELSEQKQMTASWQISSVYAWVGIKFFLMNISCSYKYSVGESLLNCKISHTLLTRSHAMICIARK
jgi:hypothetical protein